MTSKELRERAENAVRFTRRDVATLASQEEIQRLVHELQVHQIELEMQNESLRQAQRELETSHEQYQELFESAPVGYILLNDADQIVRANTAAVTLLRLSRLRLISQRLTSLVEPRDRLLLQEHLRRAAHTGPTQCEIRLLGPQASVVHVRVDISVTVDQPRARLVVLTNISERVRSQHALEALNQELEVHVLARTAELDTRNQQLEAEIQGRAQSDAQRRELELRLRESDRLESLGLLAAGIAHDFNNLLVPVLGHAEMLLLQADLPSRWRDPLLMIKRASRNASDLTHHLLVFAGRGEISLNQLSVQHATTSTLELLHTHLPAGIQLRAQLGPELPYIEGDAAQIQQVLINLVTNAAEAIEGKGTIAVTAREVQLDAAALTDFQHHRGAEPGSFVMLTVQDSGSGMDAAMASRIFDPFFSTKFTGRGLGLASVLGIVQGHGGLLRVRSRPGVGTSFDVAFRVAQAQRLRSLTPVPTDDDWQGTGSVLVIDDDDAVRHVVAQLLERLGFDVTEANGGKHGLELFRSTLPRFALVMLDWLMPGLSGAQVLKQLRELDPQLPIIVVSGYSAEDIGAQQVVLLEKPMTFAQLRDAVRNATASDAASISEGR